MEGTRGGRVNFSRLVCVVVAYAFAAPRAYTVEPGLPSRTAVVTMAARAMGTYDPDPSVRNPDWLAEHFIGAAERQLLEGTPWAKALDMDFRDASRIPEIETLIRVMLVRTRFFDERLRKALDGGAEQVVVLGAGFDTRAYRLRQLLRGKSVIEVDYGTTQEYKKRRVREVLGSLPQNVTYAPIDFTKESLGDVLPKYGFNSGKVTFFLWEGVSYYLPENAVRATLHYVATHSAPGSTVTLDCIEKSLIDKLSRDLDPATPPVVRAGILQAKRMAELGEPWIFGIPQGSEAAFLRSESLEPREILPSNSVEATRRYRTRRDGTLVGNVPPSDYSPAILLDAVVPHR